MPAPAARPDLSESSRRWLATRPAESRKALGQFLTPAPVADALIDLLQISSGMRVLDPGVGTGELLRALADREPSLKLFGWDRDSSALAAAGELVPEATLTERSALDLPFPATGSPDRVDPPDRVEGPFDLVIANPPYFQVRLSPDQRERFREVVSGRANVFALFFKVAVDLLAPGGQLGFIVPPSMNSGAYFENLREFLIERTEITGLSVLSDADWFEDVNTAVQLLVLRKRDRTDPERWGQAAGGRDPSTGVNRVKPFIFERRPPGTGFRRVVFTEEPERLAHQFTGRRSLWELGYEAATGTVVWNQNREQLRDRPGPGTVPLIWSHNLRSAGPPVPLARYGKPEFFTGRPPKFGPALLVNRVVGAVGSGELRTAFVAEGEPFLAENHVNVIWLRTDPGAPGAPAVGWKDLQNALDGPEAVERVRLLTGNTQISARELTHMLPLI